ncbi:hypothetical protein AW902_05475 [Pseudomonas aeruginosa]|nr:hypothetical protein AW902_05475 [Pseudomonas aeruginosa]KXD20776.1 hypothetical protein AW903_05890 [Pseudomonas aeruginosa]
MKKTVAPKAAKPAPAVETREPIEAQVAAFLQAGGEIQKIAKGVSGQVYGPSRQITISKKR